MNEQDRNILKNGYDDEGEDGDEEYVELGGPTTVLPEEEKKNPYNTRKNHLLTFLWLCLLVAALIVADRVGLDLTGGSNDADEPIQVSVAIEADGVYGVGMHYGVNRTIIGSQVCMADPEMTKPLTKGETIWFSFTPAEFQEGDGPEDGAFFILPGILREDGSELPAGDAWEWAAVYGEDYSFELTGSAESGFELAQTAAEQEIASFEWKETP